MKRILMTQFLGCVAFGLVVATSVWATETTDHQTEGEPKARVFRFDYGARLNRIPHGAHVRVWLPVPQTNDHQKVEAFETSWNFRSHTPMRMVKVKRSAHELKRRISSV